MTALSDRVCKACHGGMPVVGAEEAKAYLVQLPDWTIESDGHLHKILKTADFKSALSLANRIGGLAEQEQHHPDLLVRWGELRIELWTHAVGGLTETDFVFAAKIDRTLLEPTD